MNLKKVFFLVLFLVCTFFCLDVYAETRKDTFKSSFIAEYGFVE